MQGPLRRASALVSWLSERFYPLCAIFGKTTWEKIRLAVQCCHDRPKTYPLRDKRGCIELHCPNQLSSVPVDFPSGPREKLSQGKYARAKPVTSPLAQGRGSGGAEHAPSVLIKHDSTPSWSVYMRTWVLQLPSPPLSARRECPCPCDTPPAAPHPRHRLKQLPHQRALLRPRVGKKQANVGDGALHAVVAQWRPGLGGVVVSAPDAGVTKAAPSPPADTA